MRGRGAQTDEVQALRQLAVTIAGVALLVVGAALMVLPGPGILLIVAGLAVLATEYVWAQSLLRRAKRQAKEAQQASVASPARTAASVLFAVALGVCGVLMIVVDDVGWPVLDRRLDSLWGPVAGTVLVAGAVALLTTTVLTLRLTRGRPTTYTHPVRRGRATADRPER